MSCHPPFLVFHNFWSLTELFVRLTRRCKTRRKEITINGFQTNHVNTVCIQSRPSFSEIIRVRNTANFTDDKSILLAASTRRYSDISGERKVRSDQIRFSIKVEGETAWKTFSRNFWSWSSNWITFLLSEVIKVTMVFAGMPTRSSLERSYTYSSMKDRFPENLVRKIGWGSLSGWIFELTWTMRSMSNNGRNVSTSLWRSIRAPNFWFATNFSTCSNFLLAKLVILETGNSIWIWREGGLSSGVRRNFALPYKTAISSSTWLVVVNVAVDVLVPRRTRKRWARVSPRGAKLALNSPSFQFAKLPTTEAENAASEKRERLVRRRCESKRGGIWPRGGRTQPSAASKLFVRHGNYENL